MKSSDDLKNLLDRLKDEVGPLPQAQPEAEAAPAEKPRRTPQLFSRGARPQQFPSGARAAPFAAGERTSQFAADRQERFSRPGAPSEQRAAGAAQNPAWSENKESMLFGMLASLAGALSGILAGFDYLVLIGTVVFALFSMVMLIALLRAALHQARRGGIPPLSPSVWTRFPGKWRC